MPNMSWRCLYQLNLKLIGPQMGSRRQSWRCVERSPAASPQARLGNAWPASHRLTSKTFRQPLRSRTRSSYGLRSRLDVSLKNLANMSLGSSVPRLSQPDLPPHLETCTVETQPVKAFQLDYMMITPSQELQRTDSGSRRAAPTCRHRTSTSTSLSRAKARGRPALQPFLPELVVDVPGSPQVRLERPGTSSRGHSAHRKPCFLKEAGVLRCNSKMLLITPRMVKTHGIVY